YMAPGGYVLMERMPLTVHGKVDRRALLTLPLSLEETSLEYEAPANDLEAELAAIFGEVLGASRVSVSANFFELGGDSILALQVAAKARQHNLTLKPQEILRYQTVRDLAPMAVPLDTPAAVASAEPDAAPLTPIQHWFFTLDVKQRSHWN